MSLDFLIPPIFLIAFVFLPLRLFLLPFALSGAGWFFWGCLVLLMPTHLRSRSGRSCGSFPASCYFSLYEIFKNLMLPSGKFFWKNIAISPNFVYTGRCIGHPSLRRKQVSSPPVQPHPAASRRGRQNCLPRLFCCFFYSAGIRIFSVVIAPYFRSHGSAIVPVPALSALLPNRLLHFSGFFDWPDIPRFRLCHRHGSRLFPALLSSRLLLLFGADICRYFLFSGIDSSPAPESFFSAGVPFLDFREGCFYPFGFLRCRFFGLHPPVLSSYCPIF